MEMVHFIPPNQRRLAILAAQADTAPVLICGGSGTGKGAIAHWIHKNSPRSARPFVTAKYDIPLIRQVINAQGGTFLVPEIGEWPLSDQKAILEVLKSKSVPLPADSGTRMLLHVRIIATTDQNLEGRAHGGLFNPELLEKLNVFRIEMPPLSKRMEEFDDIVHGITGEIIRELHKEHLRSISEPALEMLRSYEWPGNLRELRNVLRLAVVSANGDRIEISDLPEFGHDRIDFRATREQFEKIYILELLKTYDWEIDKTCKMSRMEKGTLLMKMKQYGIEPQAPLPA